MKTPEQIASEAITADAGVPNHLSEIYSNTFEGVRDLIAAAIEADRAQRGDTPGYKEGDPDPTPNDGGVCGAIHFGLLCTWNVGHRGQHVAGGALGTVLAAWYDEEEN